MKLQLKGDKIIWLIVAFLAMVSVLAVYSSSSFLVRGAENSLSKVSIFLEQIKSVIFGLGILFICYFMPLKVYRALSFFFFGLCIVMLIMLYIPGLQAKVNGAVRGIKIMGKTLQVFEFVKVGTILFIASVLERYESKISTWKGYFLYLILPIAVVCLLIIPNSFSSTLLIAGVSFMILFFMEVKGKFLIATIAAGVAVIGILFLSYKGLQGLGVDDSKGIMKMFNRFGTVENRIKTFLSEKETEDTMDITQLSSEELAEKDKKERQSQNAKVAISEGKILGKGPGHSTQRFSLSMAFSDFVFASIVEEYGLAGGFLVIAAYLILLFRGIALASRCSTPFSSAAVIGISFMLVFQAFLHIMVNVGLLPVTGHTLPLVSHGGTAYIVLCGAFGILLSISKTIEKQDAEKAALAAQAAETEVIENDDIIIKENEDESEIYN
ncbi:MAG: FtsW/RodA/SpoVE family cell cycle protein [Bacteroidales bacterium]|nr:FtsW/RodA/SpoVE family cell cycle protein [Bacteroidales bacterium]